MPRPYHKKYNTMANLDSKIPQGARWRGLVVRAEEKQQIKLTD